MALRKANEPYQPNSPHGIFEINRFLELVTNKGTNPAIGEFQSYRRSFILACISLFKGVEK